MTHSRCWPSPGRCLADDVPGLARRRYLVPGGDWHGGRVAHLDDVRYGVFLLPDAKTSAAVTTITGSLRAQFGVVSAGRFPPHITLAGSLPLRVSEADLTAVVREVAGRHSPTPVTNAGVKQLWGSVVAFDVHANGCGRPNVALVDLAVDTIDVVRPLLRPTPHLAADLHPREDWHGHISLASHELADRPELRDEVELFVRLLDTPYPDHFTAARLAVYRFHHRDWTGDWWTDFSWEFVCAYALRTTAP